MTNSDNDRYFDFTEKVDVHRGFEAGPERELWMRVHCEEIQKALSRRNPIVGLKQLVAYSLVLQAQQGRSIGFILLSIRMLLILQVVLTTIVIGVLIV